MARCQVSIRHPPLVPSETACLPFQCPPSWTGKCPPSLPRRGGLRCPPSGIGQCPPLSETRGSDGVKRRVYELGIGIPTSIRRVLDLLPLRARASEGGEKGGEKGGGPVERMLGSAPAAGTTRKVKRVGGATSDTNDGNTTGDVDVHKQLLHATIRRVWTVQDADGSPWT
eukprot:scaffold1909_cov303-Pavlova_lutheri.AAC.4